MTALHYREAVDGEVRDIDEKRREVLVTIPHEKLDTYCTDFARDCFAGSFQGRLPGMVWAHVKTEPIGHVRQAQVTPAANELVAQFSDFDAVPRARQAFVQLRDGDICDFSFGYRNAKVIKHPTVANAFRHTSADMYEISPVLVGSIPGAMATGVRAVAEASGIADLIRAGEVTMEDAAEVLRAAGETLTDPAQLLEPERERIVVSDLRGMTLTVGQDGTVTTTGGETRDDSDDIDDLVAMTDAVLDEAAGIVHANDTSSWPAAAVQLAALVLAAQETCGQIMQAAGIDDPDYDDPQAVVTVPARSAEPEDEQTREVDETDDEMRAAQTELDRLLYR